VEVGFGEGGVAEVGVEDQAWKGGSVEEGAVVEPGWGECTREGLFCGLLWLGRDT
jgi:hypothetical protein